MVTPRSPLGQGGSERHVMEVSRRLAATGVEVEVLCADSPGPALLEERHAGVPIHSVRGWPANRDYYLAPRIWPEMAHRGPWDVIHVQSYHTLVPPLAMRRALSLGVPYVVTFHSGGHSSPLRHRLRGLQRRALRPLLARAARLIGVAQFEIDLYSRELRIPPERFALIPNGVEIEPAEDPGATDPVEGGREGAVIASIGRLERYKGHQHAIDALPHVLQRRPEARLLIVGRGPYEDQLRRRAEALGVAALVEFTSLPAEDRRGMAALLRRASLVVSMSEYETHPLVALEAAAAGRPLLVADRAGLAEVAGEGLARAISPHAPAPVLAAAIVEELDNPGVRPTPRLVSWDECAASLHELYRTVA